LHAGVLDAATLARLCAPDGLAPRRARHCGPALRALDGARPAPPALAEYADALAASGFGNVLVHGTGALAGTASAFALFGMPAPAGAREAHFLSLLLPHLHLALARLCAAPAPGAPAASMARPLSARETEILRCLREGKKNAEIGATLGISALTVKNHLQRMYPVLGVRNRTEAVARSQGLH
jgi:DNA-binding CsgD family transcriptional regulator